MNSRPQFTIDDFVRVHRVFDHGLGPAEAWTQIMEISGFGVPRSGAV